VQTNKQVHLTRQEHIISDELRKKRALVLAQLAKTPAGMDPTLEASVPDGVAYHHAGMLKCGVTNC
jgi:replicative superfamily II helicase